jgi:hypothetical protein
MARFILENNEIVNHINIINFFDGTIEKLDPFISSVDHLLSHSPIDSHAYILGAILNTKIDSHVRSNLPNTITTWAQEFKETLNYSKFHTDMVRARVGDFEKLNLFLEEMKKKLQV